MQRKEKIYYSALRATASPRHRAAAPPPHRAHHILLLPTLQHKACQELTIVRSRSFSFVFVRSRSFSFVPVRSRSFVNN